MLRLSTLRTSLGKFFQTTHVAFPQFVLGLLEFHLFYENLDNRIPFRFLEDQIKNKIYVQFQLKNKIIFANLPNSTVGALIYKNIAEGFVITLGIWGPNY